MRLAAICLPLCVTALIAQAQSPHLERCMACHSGTEATKELGPNLAGVFGRKAGSRDDFRYSRALSRSGIIWDEQNLDAYLKAPEQFVPGNRMTFEGLSSDAERAAIVQYLKTLK